MSVNVYVTEKAYQQIQSEVRRHPGEETGGIMVGFRTPTDIIVTSVTGPGPNAKHSPNFIQFDEDYCLAKARQLEHEQLLRYIGDWHCHPFTKLKPSKTDKRSFASKSLTHYQTPLPLMIITGPEPLIPLQAFVLNKSIVPVTPQLIDISIMRELKKQALTV